LYLHTIIRCLTYVGNKALAGALLATTIIAISCSLSYLATEQTWRELR
jgi:hypothetical protein